MKYEEYIYIPRDRLGVLIGEDGSTRARIEKEAGVAIKVDSGSGGVTIERGESADPLKAMKAHDIVKAIARGFPPKKAMILLKEDTYFKVIDLRDYVGNSKKALERQKARIIGTDGKARRMLEETTGASISVYGKTVSIIGTLEEMDMAYNAVEMLAQGTPHGNVYKYLHNKLQYVK